MEGNTVFPPIYVVMAADCVTYSPTPPHQTTVPLAEKKWPIQDINFSFLTVNGKLSEIVIRHIAKTFLLLISYLIYFLGALTE